MPAHAATIFVSVRRLAKQLALHHCLYTNDLPVTMSTNSFMSEESGESAPPLPLPPLPLPPLLPPPPLELPLAVLKLLPDAMPAPDAMPDAKTPSVIGGEHREENSASKSFNLMEKEEEEEKEEEKGEEQGERGGKDDG